MNDYIYPRIINEEDPSKFELLDCYNVKSTITSDISPYARYEFVNLEFINHSPDSKVVLIAPCISEGDYQELICVSHLFYSIIVKLLKYSLKASSPESKMSLRNLDKEIRRILENLKGEK